MTVKEISPKRDRTKASRQQFFRDAKTCLKEIDDLEGFAIVMWDSRGDAVSGYRTITGPIGRQRMPDFAKDVLSRHVASKL